MKIKIKLAENTLIAKGVQAEQASKAIEGFFSVLGKQQQVIEVAPPTIKANKTMSIPREEVKAVLHKGDKVIPKADAEKFKEIAKVERTVGLPPMIPPAVVTQNAPKVLPKIDDQRSLHTPIGELIPQEHWETGIKIVDGVNKYRTHYWCDCGSKGRRYVDIKDETLKCRDCEKELYIEDATPNLQENGLPERDNFGNFFIAREVVEAK